MRFRLNFELPGRIEWALFIVAGLMLIIFDWTQNMFQFQMRIGNPDYLHYLLWGFIPAIVLFWISFIVYHVVLFIAYGRAIQRRGTHYVWDWLFGTLAFAGMFFLLVGGIGAMYFAPKESLPFFFDIAQITIYHFGGVLLQLIGLGYFIVTE